MTVRQHVHREAETAGGSARQPRRHRGLVPLAGLLATLALAASAGAADWDAGGGDRWSDLLAKARAEGGPAVIAGCAVLAPVLPPAFKRDTGLEITFLAGQVADTENRYRQEALTGRGTIDIRMAGSAELDLAKSGHLVDLTEALILPNVVDPGHWTAGGLTFVDNSKRFMAVASKYAIGRVLINREAIDPSRLRSMADLLRPEFKGKIASYDPTISGAGQAAASYFAEVKGADFVKTLMAGQEVVFSREARQLVEWAARGVYPIVIAADVAEVEHFRRRGVTSLASVAMEDAPGSLVAGCTVVNIPKTAPHMATAIVYANWFLSQAGQDAFVRGSGLPSLRSDVTRDGVPVDIIPLPGTGYGDQMREDWFYNIRPRVQAELRRALDR